MQANCTWELNDKDSVASGERIFIPVLVNHGVEHASQHAVLKEEEHEAVEDIFSDDLTGKEKFLLITFNHCQHCHCMEIFFEFNVFLVINLFSDQFKVSSVNLFFCFTFDDRFANFI